MKYAPNHKKRNRQAHINRTNVLKEDKEKPKRVITVYNTNTINREGKSRKQRQRQFNTFSQDDGELGKGNGKDV